MAVRDFRLGSLQAGSTFPKYRLPKAPGLCLVHLPWLWFLEMPYISQHCEHYGEGCLVFPDLVWLAFST